MNQVISLAKGEVINLSKHPAIDLSKGGKGLRKVIVGLGWDPVGNTSGGGLFGMFKAAMQNIDCDAFAALCDMDNRIGSNQDIVYFGHLRTNDGAVVHTGDNLTGDGDGDDEQIIVDVQKLRTNVDKVVFGVNIYSGRSRNQNFGMLRNAFIRIVDADTNKELCRYNLNDMDPSKTTMFFGEIFRQNGEWSFSATGLAVAGDSIGEVLRPYMR